jgi:glutathione peroxidase
VCTARDNPTDIRTFKGLFMLFQDFEAQTIQGKAMLMKPAAGKVVLVVNTASACGFTPQFKGLEELHQKFGSQGLMVIGFPCNQFGAQDPGSDGEIAEFCQMNYGVSFQMMGKVDVNGDEAHPLFKWLKSQAPGLLGSEGIKWNFTKFLIGKDGLTVKRYAPQDEPSKMSKDIEAALLA